jgi:hypothetical protein
MPGGSVNLEPEPRPRVARPPNVDLAGLAKPVRVRRVGEVDARRGRQVASGC